MSKKFKTKEEMDKWFSDHAPKTVEEMLAGKSDHQYLDELISEGYTDLDNLIEDGHAYMICGHTNNGWLYRDEADMDYIIANNRNVEIRRRQKVMQIKEMREYLGFSRAAFSRFYNIPIRTLENWESGKRQCPEYVLELLERCVKIDKRNR